MCKVLGNIPRDMAISFSNMDEVTLTTTVKDNINLREKVMFGAFLSGIALMNSGTGPAAAMSYPLGVHYGVPHGIGGGIFLPHIVEKNIKIGFFGYTGLYQHEKNINSSKEDSKTLLQEMKTLWEILQIPKNLRPYGFSKNEVDRFITDTMKLKGALDQNPMPFFEKEISSVLHKLL